MKLLSLGKMTPAAALMACCLFLPVAAAAQHDPAAIAGREKRPALITDMSDRAIPEPADASRAGEPFRAYNDLLKMRAKCRDDMKKAIAGLRERFPDGNSTERMEIEALYADAVDKNNKFNDAIYNFIRGANKASLVNQWLDAEFAYVALVNSHADSHGRHNVCKNCITVVYPLACQYWCSITKLPQRKQLAEDFIAGVRWE
jgi:hypothetical protein